MADLPVPLDSLAQWARLMEPPAAEVRSGSNLGAGDPAPGALNQAAVGEAPRPRINPTKRVLRFTVPLTDGDTYLGDIELAVSPKDELSVAGPRLLELIKPALQGAVFARLSANVTPTGRLDEAALAKEGVRLVYDAEKLALQIQIPLEARNTASLSLRGDKSNQVVTLEPARLSGYLNVHAAGELVERGANPGLNAPTAALDGAIRFNGLVLEGEGYVSGRREDPAFRRVGTRLVYEDLRHTLRFTLGDTSWYARQFQAGPPLFGLGISRIYSQLDPQREIRSGGAQSFSLLAPSYVETIINGRVIERKRYQPGNYTLQDFPVAQGANAVKLRIEDASGKERVIDFSVYANQTLLAKGITEFSLFGGVYSVPTLTGLAYSGDWFATGFVRRGLTPQITAGVNFQANRTTRQIGAEILAGTPIGLTGFNIAASSSRARGTGMAASFTYERILSGAEGRASNSLRAAAEWRSRSFDVPDQFASGTPQVALRASADAVHSFQGNSFAGLGGQYERNYAAEASYGAHVNGGADLNERMTAVAEAGFNRGVRRETYVRVGLRMRFGALSSAQLDVDTTGQAQAGFTTGGGDGDRAWSASGNVSQSSTMVSLGAGVARQTNRGEFGVEQAATYDKAGHALSDARTTLRASFAIAMADGQLALGRLVSESFLIARAHRTLLGAPVYLEPNEKGETARAGALGPALDGQISAHSFRSIDYAVPAAPAGYDLGAGTVTIRPPYRAGYFLRVGSDYHILALGRLIDGSGEPIRLLAGDATELSNPKRPAVTVFTGREGRFSAQSLRKGRWRIVMPTEPPTTFEFDIVENADGIVRVGDLKPVPATKGENQ